MWVVRALENKELGKFENFPTHVKINNDVVPIANSDIETAISSLITGGSRIVALTKKFGPRFKKKIESIKFDHQQDGGNPNVITDLEDAFFNIRPRPIFDLDPRSKLGQIQRFSSAVLGQTIKTAALSGSAAVQIPLLFWQRAALG